MLLEPARCESRVSALPDHRADSLRNHFAAELSDPGRLSSLMMATQRSFRPFQAAFDESHRAFHA
ncbi:MAG: hypothetical protein OXC14_16995 [Rhodospirillaceae bacterium]|nr:hypothetical protein [Rhodospirillaceae bacterium]